VGLKIIIPEWTIAPSPWQQKCHTYDSVNVHVMSSQGDESGSESARNPGTSRRTAGGAADSSGRPPLAKNRLRATCR
jgi:hypothetical protein